MSCETWGTWDSGGMQCGTWVVYDVGHGVRCHVRYRVGCHMIHMVG